MTPKLGAAKSLHRSGASFSSRDALLAWMQEIAPYGIFTTDTSLRIQSWNHWLATHSGYSAEEVIGRPLVEAFPAIVSRRLEERFQHALKGEISFLSSALHQYLLPFPSPLPKYDVPHMLQTARIAPLPVGDEIIGTITILEDVTERDCQAVTLQRQQYHDQLLSRALAILLQSDDPLKDVADLFSTLAPTLGIEAFFGHAFDTESKTLQLSAASGLSPSFKSSIASFPLDAALCGACVTRREQTLVSFLQTSQQPEFSALRSAGFRFFCCSPLWVGERLFGAFSVGSYSRDTMVADDLKFLSTLAQYVGIAIDRTQREAELRQAQLRLNRHAEELETKVQERTARLHDSIVQLESFSYSVAHDLRAPIRSLRGYADILLADYAQALPEDGRFIVQRLERASKKLDALTRDLLHFSRIAQQDVRLVPVDVMEIVQELVSLSPALEAVLRIERPLGVVWAQRTLLQQCFSNLFDNALKFARTGVPVRVVIRSERTTTLAQSPTASPFAGVDLGAAVTNEELTTNGTKAQHLQNRLTIWVEDNGIGIAAHAHERIFGIFERVAGQESVEGTGIGLAIVARAMQRMNGSCGVKSELGHGSRFWLELAEAVVK